MMRTPHLARLAIVCLLFPAVTMAQAPTPEDLAKRSEVAEVSLSPNGDYVAMAVPSADGTETQLQILSLDSGSTKPMRFGKQQHVTGIYWSDADQVVVSRAKMEPLRAQPFSMGDLYSSDIDGKNQSILFAYLSSTGLRAARRQDEGSASVVAVLDDEPGKILVQFVAWPQRRGDEKRSTSIYKVDTRTGNRQEIEHTNEPASYMFDHANRARLKVTTDVDDTPVLMYRPGAGSEWQPVPKTLAGYSMSLVYVEPDNNTGYARITDKGEPSQLYKVDLAKGTRVRVAGRNDVGIGSVLYGGHDGAPFGVTYDAGKYAVEYFEPSSEWAKLHAGLMQAFPGQMVSFVNWSRDSRKVLFYAWGDRNPGEWYVLDRTAGKMVLINQAKPWIKPSLLASTSQISFKTRDGLTLYGLYTPPAGGGAGAMVVMPHGGPHGVYDQWGYDPTTQFLASRGYGVLQVNYRGSGGRGKDFEESGYREWGGKMQDDLADGVNWAVGQKLADPGRICTYGASYGGYAALMQPIRYPDLYKCAIGYVGVYDLQVMKKEGDTKDWASGRRTLDRYLGTDVANLQAWSPAQNVDKIKVPVFLVQGNVDRRVPMAQFSALKNAFESAGTPVETMIGEGEGHGFYKPENKAELYRKMDAFLNKYIGPAAK